MKNLIIVFLLTVILNQLHAKVDECKTDIYFANGMLTSPDSAKKSAKLLEVSILDTLGSIENFKKQIGKVDYAYNNTVGFWSDLWESTSQILDMTEYQQRVEDDKATIHDKDLEKQVTQYQDSIKNGHKVLVVAHSQGNLFTREAYLRLGANSQTNWMQDYFEAISVATPDFTGAIKPDTPVIG